MKILLGVIGPRDLVDLVQSVLADDERVELVPLAYGHESDALDLALGEHARVDAWLFTGIIPYTAVKDSVTAPAAYLDYNGSTILQGLVRLLRDGRDVSHLSVDTLRAQDVHATLAEVGVPIGDVQVLPYVAGLESSETTEFHRRNLERDPASVVITCVSSVYEQLGEAAPALRLVPSILSIRGAVEELYLRATNQVSEQAQVAIGLIDFGSGRPVVEDPRDWIADMLPNLGATLGTSADGLAMVVTTRGALSMATREFSSSPFLADPAFEHAGAGFGVGNSAVEAEGFARRALNRAKAAPHFATLVSFRSNLDIVLRSGSQQPEPAALASGWGSLAVRTGLSIPTLERVKAIVDGADGGPLTTRDFAHELGVQLRTARRMIRHFEMVGLAERVGLAQDNQPGRPLTLYRINI